MLSVYLPFHFHVLDSISICRMSNKKWTWVLPRDLCLWTLQPFMGRESCSQNLELEIQVNARDLVLHNRNSIRRHIIFTVSQKWNSIRGHINMWIYKLIFTVSQKWNSIWGHINMCIYKLIFTVSLFGKLITLLLRIKSWANPKS